ncbi:MAG: hypothetical protein NZZ60_00095 [Bacteroidia bacterium]|nr:hypothetical protein [Bacteroidia bacterium]MCX7651992.1 proton-conducting transporter membrane subunit [Bacteroidia bacterium]MDW8416337.1 proton-conducting transporter membrane subunit [Bacteroidia bacterium]
MTQRSLLGLVALGCILTRLWARDPLLVTALEVTATIAGYILLTGNGKEKHSPSVPYLLYASAFMVAVGGIMLFVQGTHSIWVFAGWEMVSIAGWGLIAFGRRLSPRSLEAAFIAFMTNRLGDAFWLAGVFSGSFSAGVWIGVLIKAGIFPFTFWLVQAMLAPAPVSALLHSALLVGMAAYLPIRYPAFVGHGLPAWGYIALWVASLMGSLGAVLSRSSKTTLAWTTAAHLGIVLYLTPQPERALSYLLHHSYLKAALFLLLDSAQKRAGFSLHLTLLWWFASSLLFMSEALTDEKILLTELITAIALGQAWARKEKNLRLNFHISEVAPLSLLSLAILHMEMPPWQTLLPIAGLITGAFFYYDKVKLRLDMLPLQVMRLCFTGWEMFSRWASLADSKLNAGLDGMARRAIKLGDTFARAEALLSQRGWLRAAQMMRRSMAFLSGESSQAYTQALSWGLLLTLIIGMLWRLLH